MDDTIKNTTIHKAIINSPNSVIVGSFNTEVYKVGFTETPFIQACMLLGIMAWICSFTAMSEVIPSVTVNLGLALWAVVLMTIAMVLAFFGYEASERGANKDCING